jgi:hypothetical protein
MRKKWVLLLTGMVVGLGLLVQANNLSAQKA